MRKSIKSFIVEARGRESSSKGVFEKHENEHTYRYSKGNLRYVDSFVGDDCFTGQVLVYEDDFPVWGFVYYGKELRKLRPHEARFLQIALSTGAVEGMYRGPKEFSDMESDLLYTNVYNKESGVGREEIHCDSELIFECDYIVNVDIQ